MARERVQSALDAMGMGDRLRVLLVSTRTAREAAAALGCEVAQIAKSLVFKLALSGKPVLVVASGANRVDVAKLAALVGEPVEKATAGFVRQATGFAIGGVPPIALEKPMETVLDEALFELPSLWAAAGGPHSVFGVTPAELETMTGGRRAAIGMPGV